MSEIREGRGGHPRHSLGDTFCSSHCPVNPALHCKAGLRSDSPILASQSHTELPGAAWKAHSHCPRRCFRELSQCPGGRHTHATLSGGNAALRTPPSPCSAGRSHNSKWASQSTPVLLLSYTGAARAAWVSPEAVARVGLLGWAPFASRCAHTPGSRSTCYAAAWTPYRFQTIYQYIPPL